MTQMRRISIILLTAISAISSRGAAPEGYYDSCEGKSGAALLSALCSRIASHTNVGYDGLWDVYETSDVRDDGTVWDMYSTKHWVVGKQRCGNYSLVGDCLNREHSFPKSWFNDASPMYSDAYHLYPTDGKVNGQRSNFPYGECANGTTLPSNGSVQALGKLGTSTFPGYSGKVFEPIDEYKGDFARSYFYMAACYNTKIANWNSDMLANNSYPAFTSWAVELLMKWHRQDPVSDKETKRNEAVAQWQKNRNPFIDYPDLADHIWGDKKNIPWSSTSSALPTITLPVNGSTIDMGVTAVNQRLTRTLTVQGGALTSDVKVSCPGSVFSATPATLSASQVCGAGATVTITYQSSIATLSTGTITFTSGSAQSQVTVKAKAMNGIPVGAPTAVSDQSFVINWVNIHGAGARYSIHVYRDGEAIPGYPMEVAASAQSHEVTGLDPETTYTYRVTCGDTSSETVTVTTGEAIPMIQFLFDGDLCFTALPGFPSEVAEILLDVENIDTEITISCSAPFEVSTDKASWATSTTLAPDEERFYMRVNASEEGDYTTVVRARAGDYENDITVTAIVGQRVTLYEDFEGSSAGLGNYGGGIFSGKSMDWKLINAGIYAGNSEPYHSENQSVRFGKPASGASGVEMQADKRSGIGTCSFWAQKWKSDAASTVYVEVSTDGGKNWIEVGSATIDKTDQWIQAVIPVEVSGPARVRIMRGNTGGRLNLDDVELTDHFGVGVVNKELDYHSWDAYCRDHQLVIEGDTRAGVIKVYGTDGMIRHEAAVEGQSVIALPAGVYLVSSPTFTRRVVVK